MKWMIWAMAVGTVACSAPELTRGQESKSSPAPGAEMIQVRNVTQAYNENCASCHGVNGEGGGAGTKSLITEDKFDQKWDKPFFDAIRNGVTDMGMEAYGDSWDDKSMWAMVVHIRELQLRGLRAQGMRPKPNPSGVYEGERHKFRVEDVVTSGLRTPWAVDWLPDGRMLVSNRGGSMVVVKDGVVVATVEGMPRTVELGQGGFMDIAVHPKYAENGWIYFSYTEPVEGANNRGLTKFVRGKLRFSGSTAQWVNQQTLFESDQANYTGAGVHFGSRIDFDGEGFVFFAIGDRGQQNLAQDVTKPNGKVYRLNEDGTRPADNPFRGQGGDSDAVWSYGHRNPQGLVFGTDGRLWDTEHAPRGGDELNEVVKGANYGWPLVSFCINYNDTPFGTPWPAAGQNIRMPIFRWMPSNAACGLDVVTGPAFPNWQGDLVAGGLAGQSVDRIRTREGKFVEREEILQGLGRVRDVVVGPDGFVYVALNQPDKIIRLVPVR